MDKANDITQLKNKSLSGIGALLRRQAVVKGLAFLGNIVLARILVPEIFGIYAIVAFVVQFFSAFGDVGLGAALIQKKGELSKEELSTTFWLQQMLVWVVVVIIMFTAPLAIKIYPELSASAVWLIRAMAFSFMLSSLKTIPAILMERNIEFHRIARVDIVESISFQVTAIACALAGFEVWSFIIAAVIRGFSGAVMICIISPWRPGFYFNFSAVKGLVKFGLPYQGNAILSFIKDAVTPLFVGIYAGAAAVGYVNWARTWAFAPLMLSESFGRVAFPAFSKIQHDKELLTKAIERSIRLMTFVMFPITAMMIALGPDIIRVVFTDKWMPALWAFYLYCTSPIIAGIHMPFYSAILSLGKSNQLLKMTVFLLTLEWGLGVPFIVKFGFIGVALTQPVIAVIFTYLYKFVLVKQQVFPEIFPHIKWQMLFSVILGALIKVISFKLILNLISLTIFFAGGCIFFVAMMYLFRQKQVIEFRDSLGGLWKRTKNGLKVIDY